MERKWHEKTWIIVLLVIFFWPVGIFLFFKNPYYSKNIKMGAIGLCAVIFAYAALISDNNSSNDNKPQTVATTQQDPAEVKRQEEEKRLQREQAERERAEQEAAEKARREQEAAERYAQEQRQKREEAERKKREKADKELREINSHSYTEINIATLINDAKNNAARANKNYNGKYFKIVGGIVQTIESDGDYISVESPVSDLSFLQVQCFPETNLAKEQIFQLNMNQRVTIYGKITDVGEIMGYKVELLKIE
ncbi:MAG: hypothetical protein IKT98_01330 [Selenomonadaceae bacterium]|nr:hypothetical protein [Selenomonadaceae bacterium]